MRHRPFRKLFLSLALLLPSLACLPTLRAADPPTDLDRPTADALRRAVTALLAPHKELPDPSENGLLLYALLSASQTIDDPRLTENSPEIQSLIDSVAHLKPQTVDAAFVQVEALCPTQLNPDLRLALIATQDFLLSALGAELPTSPDASNLPEIRITKSPTDVFSARAAVAALITLQSVGISSPPEVFQNTNTWLRAHQLKDGGFPIKFSDKFSDPAATAAALATLHQLAQVLPPDDPTAPPPLTPPDDPLIDTATKRFLADYSPRRRDYRYQIDVQHIAFATGQRTIAGIDIFSAFARQLLDAQLATGAWPPIGSASPAQTSLAETCKAVIFLSNCRAPIVFSKLIYPSPENKSAARPYDCTLLTSWLSNQFDKPLAWQAVDFVSPIRDWSSAPVLLITGSGDPHFSESDLAKLRAFITAGGIIFSSADNADPDFTKAIQHDAEQIFFSQYPMRELPPTHELFAGKLFAKIVNPPPLLAMSNGIRELWIHSPTDLAASWQLQRTTAHYDFNLPANIVRYATGMGTLRNPFQSLTIAPPSEKPTRTINLARLQYGGGGGNFDPEPGAWPRFAAYAAAKFHTNLQISIIPITQLDAAKTPLAHLTGAAAFNLTPNELTALKKFLDNGGTLLADSGGGNPQFTASFQKLLASLYPAIAPEDIPLNDPLYNGSLPDSIKITDVDYRRYYPGKSDDRDSLPHLQALTQNGRHIILFSPQDITSGLLGTETWGITGFTPDTALHLTQNEFVYASTK